MELYGEMLLEAGKPTDALRSFEDALLRTPKRTPSPLGLARAAAKSGDVTLARQRYMEILATPGIRATARVISHALIHRRVQEGIPGATGPKR